MVHAQGDETMAHEIEELDNVMLGSNTPAWHELGTVVAGQPNSAEAIKLAKLDWAVETEPVLLPDGQGGFITIPNTFATVRTDLALDDPRRALGIVTERYEPIDNAEAFGIVDDLVGEGGARFETAGSIRNGRMAWMMAVMPSKTTVLDDQLAQYLLLSTAHDGTRAVQINFTPVRVVCSNTLHFAIGGVQTSATIRHTKNKKQQIADAKRVLGLAGEYFDAHGQTMEKLAEKRIDDRFAAAYLQALLPDPKPEDDRKWCGNEKKRNRILELYHGDQAGGDQQAVKGTGYGLLSALGEYVDHERTVLAMGGRNKADARMSSTMFGSGARFKSQAAGLMTRVLDIDGGAELDAHEQSVKDVLAQIDLS
jgi:phage/plasmid-like protein (TIGR03299 family)